MDANALLLAARSRFPLESEAERLVPGAHLVVPSSVVGELERLVARGLPDAPTAVALARRWPNLPVSGRGDTAILDAAIRHRASVLTADRSLAARLRSNGINVLVPRDRHRLELHRGHALSGLPNAGPPELERSRRRQRL